MSEHDHEGNGFSEYKKLFEDNFARLNASNFLILQAQMEMKIEIAKLKQKAGLWGAVAGAVVAIPPLVFCIIEFIAIKGGSR